MTLSYGQISPGDLSSAHAELEGMSNCTLCHELGEKVLNSKCLDCHDDIQSLLTQNRGFHSDSSVEKKDCFEFPIALLPLQIISTTALNTHSMLRVTGSQRRPMTTSEYSTGS